MLHTILQTAVADSTAVNARSFIETVKETPANELLKDLGLQAVHFGLKLLAALALFIIGAWLIKLVRRAVKKALIRKNSEHTIISFTDSFSESFYRIISFDRSGRGQCIQ